MVGSRIQLLILWGALVILGEGLRSRGRRQGIESRLLLGTLLLECSLQTSCPVLTPSLAASHRQWFPQQLACVSITTRHHACAIRC